MLYSCISLPCMFEPDYVSSAQYCISPEVKNVDNDDKTEINKLVSTL